MVTPEATTDEQEEALARDPGWGPNSSILELIDRVCPGRRVIPNRKYFNDDFVV